MTDFGSSLSSEEHRPADLVRYARRAEGERLLVLLPLDHFHPWIDAQGQSPFAWTVVGGVAAATRRVALGTGVTCPTGRDHPAIAHHGDLFTVDDARIRPFPPSSRPRYRSKRYRRKLLVTTEALENAIAAPAMMGLSRPDAASGIAATL